jgi:hypothetical protein
MIGKALEDWTVGDWVDAQSSMNNASFKKYLQTAKAGGIVVPSVVAFNFSPRITIGSLSGADSALYVRVRDEQNLKTFNDGVKNWCEKVKSELKASAENTFGHRISDQISTDFPRLSDSIQTNIRFDKTYKLETRSVGFSFARAGVYLHYGAGRGYAGMQGSKWTDQYGRLKTTNPESLGKMGTGERTGEHWFNDVIRRNVDELADILANYSLDLSLNMSNIFLPE